MWRVFRSVLLRGTMFVRNKFSLELPHVPQQKRKLTSIPPTQIRLPVRLRDKTHQLQKERPQLLLHILPNMRFKHVVKVRFLRFKCRGIMFLSKPFETPVMTGFCPCNAYAKNGPNKVIVIDQENQSTFLVRKFRRHTQQERFHFCSDS